MPIANQREQLRKAAEAGDSAAGNELALALVKQGETQEAESWWRKTAEAGDSSSAYNLALLLGKQNKTQEAETWYRKAAEGGDSDAMNELAIQFADQGRSQEAEFWLRKAAEAGNSDAANNLGVLLEETDPAAAQRWWEQAAAAGDSDAAAALRRLRALSKPLPLSFAGRSPFDPIRLRWGGIGAVGWGAFFLSRGNPAGVVFGLLFLGLGVSIWLLTSFGRIPWNDLPSNKKAVVGTGAVAGLLFVYMFFAVWFAILWGIRVFAKNA